MMLLGPRTPWECVRMLVSMAWWKYFGGGRT